jgi:hypothetical protein
MSKKPKQPKPVKAWATQDKSGGIDPVMHKTRSQARLSPDCYLNGSKVIRVEIRVLPKGKRK